MVELPETWGGTNVSTFRKILEAVCLTPEAQRWSDQPHLSLTVLQRVPFPTDIGELGNGNKQGYTISL